jgi:N-glycosylase/DNA lyase
MSKEFEELKEIYKKNKVMIKDFLKKAKQRSDEHITAELIFCMQTPQSKAKHARETVNRLKACNKIITADETDIRQKMHGVRFADKKAKYIAEAKKKVEEIKKMLDTSPFELREWLVKNIKGMGMKLASHYLRNIGIFGLAILDVHVQNFMEKSGMLEGKVGHLNKKQYLENEKRYLNLAKELGIFPEELDIAIWLYGNKCGVFYG